MQARLAVLALAVLFGDAPAAGPPRPCPDGRFVLDPQRPFLGNAPGATNVWLDRGRLALSPHCPLVAARVRARRGGLLLRARWDACGTAFGRSKLVARVSGPDCARLRGTFRTRFVARPGAGGRSRTVRLRAGRSILGDRVPTDPRSPWPKFRRDAAQTGRSPIRPSASGGLRWAFPTGKGIFSTPVVGHGGRVYVGSADRIFYALERDGTVAWTLETGEIIDSAALLDDEGLVYFGSGDGRLYVRRADTGEAVRTFQADPPAATGAFIDWFEANVAMGPDRTLYVPNDNFFTYAIDPRTLAVRWRFRTADQTWSLPAVDVDRDLLYMGNNNLLALLGPNTFAIEAATGTARWTHATDGSIAASPMLTPDGLVVVGGFDGWVRAYDAESGAARWAFGARDHIYASPGLLPDGTIVQPSADGSVYALDPASGAVRWQFDTRDAIRSSPAIDGDGNVYVGSGEGRLFVLNPDGTLRWSLRLIDAPRDDLNASPALGLDAIVIAGESGEVFSVPYDWCLRPEAASDPGCRLGPGEDLPSDGARLYFTSRFGRLEDPPPPTIEANQPLAFTLFVRSGGDTVLAHLDAARLVVTVDPPAAHRIDVSGDRKFVTLIPAERWSGPGGGTVTVDLAGNFLVDPDREGLRFSGGRVGGAFAERFSFTVPPAADGGVFPLPIPAAPGDPSGLWELSRFATPLPTILPSYNQIGFDSLHYLLSLVESSGDGRTIGWVHGGRRAVGSTRTVADPTSRVLFPVELRHDGGLWTLVNEDGFSIEFNGIRLPFRLFRLATRVDTAGAALAPPALSVLTVCGGITFYGQFLRQLGFCNPQTDVLDVFGAAELSVHPDSPLQPPTGLGAVTLAATTEHLTATFAGSSLRPDTHQVGLLAVDAATGRPLALDYGYGTERTAGPDGTLTAVRVPYDGATIPETLRIYLLVDGYPAARTTAGRP